MKITQVGLFAAGAVLVATLVVTGLANAQQGGFGGGGGMAPPQMMPGMQMGGAQPVVVNDGGALYIIRGNNVCRVDKSSMKVTGQVELPMGRPGMPMENRGGGGFGGGGQGGSQGGLGGGGFGSGQ